MQSIEKISEISLNLTNNLNKKLSGYLGKWIIIYFYPKDATPGCTTEACDFRDNHITFVNKNTVILGVSRDKVQSHDRFKEKQQLPFELIIDEDEMLCDFFQVIKMKNMYGKQVRGIERSTFIIDPEGIIRYSWRNVKVANHVTEVLTKIQELQLSLS